MIMYIVQYILLRNYRYPNALYLKENNDVCHFVMYKNQREVRNRI